MKKQSEIKKEFNGFKHITRFASEEPGCDFFIELYDENQKIIAAFKREKNDLFQQVSLDEHKPFLNQKPQI